MKKVLFVIPAYNEEASILNTYKQIEDYNKKNKMKIDVVVINDGSKDSTENILVENKINHVKLINNLGIGGAVQTGYKYALENDYDIAIQFDADGQHDVNYALDMVDPIINNEANMVIGSRFIDKDLSGFKSSASRRIGINIISFFIKLTTGKKIYDCTSGYRAIDKKLISYFANNYPTEYPEPISSVDILKQEYEIKEVPVMMRERQGGTSSIRSWKNAYYMINVILSIIAISMGGRRK